MTEWEWQTHKQVVPLLAFIGNRLTERQRTCFTVACCLQVRPLWLDARLHQAATLLGQPEADAFNQSERLAGQIQAMGAYMDLLSAERKDAPTLARMIAAYTLGCFLNHSSHADLIAAHAARALAYDVPALQSVRNLSDLEEHPEWKRAYRSVRRLQADLLRDIVGNPFRLQTLEATWRTPTVLGVAEHIYAAQEFTQLPILADALEDAGCDAVDLLDHCRSSGVHTRGCWLLDVLLGKT